MADNEVLVAGST